MIAHESLLSPDSPTESSLAVGRKRKLPSGMAGMRATQPPVPVSSIYATPLEGGEERPGEAKRI